MISTQNMHSHTKGPTKCLGRPFMSSLLVWCARQESNLRPLASEANALSS